MRACGRGRGREFGGNAEGAGVSKQGRRGQDSRWPTGPPGVTPVITLLYMVKGILQMQSRLLAS